MVDFEETWRGFPQTLAEFEEAFPDEAACRSFLIKLRWGETSRSIADAIANRSGSFPTAVSSVLRVDDRPA